MSWSPQETPVNKFVLSNHLSAGICQQPKGAVIERKLDEQAGYGVDGAFVIYTGRKLAEFETELLLVSKADWDYWGGTFSKLIHAVPEKGPVKRSTGGYTPGHSHLIWHPQLYPLGITRCIVMSEPQVTIDDWGVGHIPIKFKQIGAQPPEPAVVRPEAAKLDPPLTPDQVEIVRLTPVLASKQQANKAAGLGSGSW